MKNYLEKLIGPKQAEILCREVQSTYDLSRLSERQIAEKGVSKQASKKLKAAIDLGFACVDSARSYGAKITGPEDVFKLMSPKTKRLESESFFVLILNNKNLVEKTIEVSKGTGSFCVVSPSDVLAKVLKEEKKAFIVCHNHPSGDPQPSSDDIELTKRLHEGAKLLELKLLDHVIIGDTEFTSLSKIGLIF